MLLMSTTRSAVSHVSYCAGITLTVAFAGRARLGEDPWLKDDVAEEECLTRVAELATLDPAQDFEAPLRFTDI